MFKNSDSSLAYTRFLAPMLVFLVLAMSACGGGSSSNNPQPASNPQAPSNPGTVSVAVSPASASVQAGATMQIQAAVTGSSNTTVAWSVDGVAGGNATVGTISAAGLYTAPGTPGQHTVAATSAADPTASGKATITVVPVPPPPVVVTVSPASASVQAGATTQFQAAVTGSTNPAVTWSVDGVGGGNATVGTISGAGLYTAPGTAGQHTIAATSAANSASSGSVTVTVVAVVPPSAGDITIDFNARTGGPVIPAGFFGAQIGDLSNVSEMQTLVAAGISGLRVKANVISVFATQTPNWTFIDSTLANLQQAGTKAILTIAYTPPWLQASSNPCSGVSFAHPYNSAPSDNTAYASIAAQYVAHIDKSFPGLVSFYEIWNEPDLKNGFCGLQPGESDQTRLNEYTALYQAAAGAMKQQATKDGTSILVGGPALGHYFGFNTWISQLVQLNNSGAKLVDFVSYHQYPAGSDVSHTMTWDGAGGTTSLYSRTVARGTGFAGIYQSIAKAAASAGSAVPVMLDEVNDDWDFFNDCCKNSPTYSPVFNTLVFSLLVNTAYSGTPPPLHLSYYSASNQPFCLLGSIDANNDCGTAGTLLPYPQFRAFELLASPNFLDLQAKGGNLAQSVASTTAMNSAGLVASAFYTPGSDAVVLVNPTANAITNAVLVVGNHGLNNPTATQYLLNSSTYSPTTPVPGTALALTLSATGAEATVTIPPHSVLAIKVSGQ